MSDPTQEMFMLRTHERMSRWTMGIATVQGLLLLALYRAEENDVSILNEFVWSIPLWTLAITLPVFLMLSLSAGFYRRSLIYSSALSGVLILCGFYTGSQLSAETNFASASIVPVFVLCMLLASFKGLMYLQQRVLGEPLTYPLLFSLSWRNFLITALALLFVLIVGLLLMLWGALFNAIGVPFFQYLFSKDWFLFPVLGFSFGVGISLFRQLSNVIDSITRLLQTLIRFLLPLLVLMSMTFLGSLLVVGMETLWKTGFGTGLILWLMAIMLFFVNAVYQDGRGDPTYSVGVHRVIYVGMLGLPVLASISFYGFWVRVEQYGLTVERIYGWVTWLLLTLFSLGYGLSILRRRDTWTQGLAVVNIRMGLVVLLTMLLLNSPLIDPRKLTVASQMSRLESGLITIDEFDVPYFMLHLGDPGDQALIDLRATYGEDHPALENRSPYERQWDEVGGRSDKYWQTVSKRPKGLILPSSLITKVEQANKQFDIAESIMMAVDLNTDGQDEFLQFGLMGGHIYYARYFMKMDGDWQVGQLHSDRSMPPNPGLIQQLTDGDVVLEPQSLNNVRIGTMLFQPMAPGLLPGVSTAAEHQR